MDKKKIIEKIRALQAKTTQSGCTEEEAIAAAAMVQRLLEKYNITLEECDIRESEFSKKEHPQDDQIGRSLYRVASAIAYMMDIRYWSAKPGSPKVITFFGFDHEVQIASYLLDICKNAIETQIAKEEYSARLLRERARNRYISSFIDGMTDRLAKRIREMKNKAPTGRGLIVLKRDLIDAELFNQGMKLDSRKGRKPMKGESGYQKGYEKGDDVLISQGISTVPRGRIK